MIDQIAKDYDRARTMNEFIGIELVGTYPSTDRFNVFAAFMSICMSHHESILVLVSENNRLAASALALLRPLIEAAYRGLFAGLIATDAQIATIRSGGEPYPRFNDLAKAIDDNFGLENTYTVYGGPTWKVLNDLTHTGVEQLSNRFNATGEVGSHHEPARISEMLNSATCALFSIAVPFLGIIKGLPGGRAVVDKYVALYPPPTNS